MGTGAPSPLIALLHPRHSLTDGKGALGSKPVEDRPPTLAATMYCDKGQSRSRQARYAASHLHFQVGARLSATLLLTNKISGVRQSAPDVMSVRFTLNLN
jgi:hypothetical protein